MNSNIRTPPIETPADWFGHDFGLTEIVDFLNIPRKTVEDWLVKARLCAPYPGQKRGRNRFYAPHHVYALALLAKLHKIGWPVNPGTIAGAFRAAVDAYGTPRTPQPNETWEVIAEDGARVEVDAWLCFVAVRHWAERERMRQAA